MNTAAESPIAPRTVAILGFGTVGRSVATILMDSPHFPLRLTHVFNRGVERKRVDWIPDPVLWTDRIDDVLDSDVDIIVELVGGLDPAGPWVRRALEAGKAVVTANKPLIAGEGPALTDIARRSKTQLAFEASVAGGVPVLAGILDGLSSDHLVEVVGILNGTCNYILTRIERTGVSFAEALREAQALGFAETDPTADVDGHDARDKLVILAWLALRLSVDRLAVTCMPISAIAASDFEMAHRFDATIRQVSRARRSRGGLSASVRPSMVPRGSALAAIEGSQNVVRTTGTFGGTTSFTGLGAGGDPTAVAVTSDLLAVARGRRAASAWSPPITTVAQAAEDFETAHVVRVMATGDHAVDVVADALVGRGFRVESRHALATTAGATPVGFRLAPSATDALVAAVRALEVTGVLHAPLILPVLES